MSALTLRLVKGSPLTNTELDNNFTALNNDKLESATAASTYQTIAGMSSYLPLSGGTLTGPSVVSVNSSGDALRITQVGAGNALLVEDSANPDATPFVVSANGSVVIGDTATTTTPNYAGTQQAEPLEVKSATSYAGLSLQNYVVGSGAAGVTFAHSRSGALGTHTILNDADITGSIVFSGSDGTNFIRTAQIDSRVDGTPGTNDMPGRLVFATTADGASTPTERMRIDNRGAVGINTSALTTVSFRVHTPITGGTSAYGAYWGGTVQPDVTSAPTYQQTFASTAANGAVPYTVTTLRHYSAGQGTFHADSTVTNQYGFIVESNFSGAAGTNIGFYGNVPSGTGRWNFYAAGTADNHFSGNVAIGTTTTSVAKLYVSGGNVATDQAVISRVGSGLANGSRGFRGSIDGTEYFALYNDNTNTILSASGTTRVNVVNSSGVISLGAAPGAESLRVAPVASAVNYVQIYGAVTTGAVTVEAAGSDANIWMNHGAKGTGLHQFIANSATQFRIGNTASAVNYLQAGGGATAGLPYLQAVGSDTNISIAYTTKGNGSNFFYSNNFGSLNFAVGHTASAVNYLQAMGGDGTTNSPRFIAAGTSADISVQLLTKGTGGFSVMNDASATQFRVFPTTSAVNFFMATGAVTGGQPYLLSSGADTNVGASYLTKGSANHTFYTNGFGSPEFVIAHVASSVNYFAVYGAATGGAPTIYSSGSDANIDFNLAPKGTGSINLYANGNVQFRVQPTASSVNYVQATGATTGNAPSFSAVGSDTNVDLKLSPKGGGKILVNGTAYSPEITLTDGATVNWDASTGQVAKLTLGGNRTVAAPTNLATGAFYSLNLIQDATGSRTITWNSVFAFTGGTAPTLSTAASSVDQICFRYDGTKLREVGRSLGAA